MSNLLSLPTESSLYKRQYSVFLKSPKYKIPSAHRKQEIWRQKQIYIHYTEIFQAITIHPYFDFREQVYIAWCYSRTWLL